MLMSYFLAALLEGFEIRECISFIEEHINRQVGCFFFFFLQWNMGNSTVETCLKRFLNSFLKVSMIESLRLLCLLSITENGECSWFTWRKEQFEFLPGCSNIGWFHPAGLLPKDFRSLKTQYLQVRFHIRLDNKKLCQSVQLLSMVPELYRLHVDKHPSMGSPL